MGFGRIQAFFRKYPLARGMVTYNLLWPTSNLCQQAIQGKEEFDFAQAARFSIFGTFVIAPSIYGWVKVAGYLLPGSTLRMAVAKALVEQVVYAPFAITTFYLGMTLLENKTLEAAKNEVRKKFLATWKTGACVWPVVQTINFAYSKERNRVPVISAVSFFWTVYLSYMKQLESEKEKENMNISASYKSSISK